MVEDETANSEKEKEALISFWLKNKFVKDQRVIEAFRAIDRRDFVLPYQKAIAYEDRPLPILAEQTISQPTTVVQMLEALELKPGMAVLEIGAGSGYNAALIAELVKPDGKVYSIEIIPELADFARANIKKAGLEEIVQVINADGSKGWPPAAPYDRIVVTAAAPDIPKAYVEQLKEDGILLIPVSISEEPELTELIKARKQKGGLVKKTLEGYYTFVKLRGEKGYAD
ncbi:MAG: protein-L-isoaspartate(D-aspartate) O-methyltransferase [Candidatus Woesearchaeota archaeon]